MATLTHEEDRDDVVKMDQMVNNTKAKKKKTHQAPKKKKQIHKLTRSIVSGSFRYFWVSFLIQLGIVAENIMH